MRSPYSSVGISFAGGGLKSFSHVAAIADIEKNGVEVVAVAGTSMGSVLAALYACGIRGEQFAKRLLEAEALFKEKRVLRRPTYRILPFVKERSDGFIESSDFMGVAQEVIASLDVTMLSEVPFPLCIVSVDLISGDLILFSNKPEYFKITGRNCRFYEKDIELSKAITASCAFPLIFESVIVDELRLIDGGVLLNSPGTLFNPSKVKKVVSLTTHQVNPTPIGYNFRDVAFRSVSLMMDQLERISLQEVDLHINFPVPFKIMFDVGKGKDIIEKSFDYLKENPIDYRPLMPEKSFKNLWGLLD